MNAKQWTEKAESIRKTHPELADAHKAAHLALCRAEVARRKDRNKVTEKAVTDTNAARKAIRLQLVGVLEAQGLLEKTVASKKATPQSGETAPVPAAPKAKRETKAQKSARLLQAAIDESHVTNANPTAQDLPETTEEFVAQVVDILKPTSRRKAASTEPKAKRTNAKAKAIAARETE